MKTRIHQNEIPVHLLDGMYKNEAYLRKSDLPESLIALIKIRSSQINRCGYCLDMHHKDALQAGESFDRLYLLAAWEEAPCFSDEEKAVLHLTETLTLLSEQTAETIEIAYTRMAQFYDRDFTAQVVLAICQINSWNRIAVTFGFEPGSYQVSSAKTVTAN